MWRKLLRASIVRTEPRPSSARMQLAMTLALCHLGPRRYSCVQRDNSTVEVTDETLQAQGEAMYNVSASSEKAGVSS